MKCRAAAAAVFAILTAGCGSSAGGGTSHGAVPRTIELGYAAKGRTVSAHPRDTVEVRLRSTYWRFGAVAGGVLSPGRFVSQSSRGGRPVGSGAGTAVGTFRALKAGTARITAKRRSCGEAMRCAGGLGSFSVTVVVH